MAARPRMCEAVRGRGVARLNVRAPDTRACNVRHASESRTDVQLADGQLLRSQQVRFVSIGMKTATGPLMAGSPRFVPPDSLVEITMRTSGGFFLLRPSPELNARILG